MKRLLLLAVFGCLVLAVGIQVFPEAALAADDDGDGIDNDLELVLGTDCNSADSDSDSVSDFDEVFVYGTNPLDPDTDCDGLADDVDPDPLDDSTNAGGRSTPAFSYSCSTPPAVPSTPTEGVGVNALTGQLEYPICTMDFGPGYRKRNVILLQYGSNVSHPGPWGNGVVCSMDGRATVNGNTVTVRIMLDEYAFTLSGGVYVRPNSCPGTLTYDSQADEYVFQYIRGGDTIVFDGTGGWQKRMEDRFGNTTTITRDQNGFINTIYFPEGNSVSVSQYATGRYVDIMGWAGRTWHLVYNYYDELAKVTDPRGFTTQYSYINGSVTASLNGDLTRVVLPEGQTALTVEYDANDRVSKQTRAGFDATFSYTSTATTITDFAGNQRVWNHAAGSVVPTSLVQYSNRDVRASDPATWTTTFAHNSDLLRTKVVYPNGNRTDFDWDSSFCLTEIRKKATDTDTDDNQNDLVWTNTYTSTYHQLDESTDPMGNTTDRSFDGLEYVTGITYETITHTDPDITISESFTRNSHGQVISHTDGEGVVTQYAYYGVGSSDGLLYRKTIDYGVSGLNLVHEYGYSGTRFLTSYTDPDGIVVSYTVDELGNRLTETGPDPQNYEVENNYNSNGWLVETRVENVDKDNVRVVGNEWWTTLYSHDVLGRVIEIEQEVDASTTATTTLAYDGNGNVVHVTRPEGNEIAQVWDERGALAERTRGYGSADAATEKWAYEDNGKLDTFTDGRGKEWAKTYDDYDRLVQDAKPAGEYTTYTLDKNGNVTEVQQYDDGDVLLADTKQYYDELNRVWKTERWLDHAAPTADEWLATTYTLDKRGLTTAVTDPLSQTTCTTYDNAGRRTGWEDALGNEMTWTFSGDYLVPSQVDEIENVPGGGTETFTTEFVTDNLHRVTTRRIVDRDNSANKHVFTTKFDSLNVAVEQEDAEGNKTYFTHDGFGRIVTKSVDLGGGSSIDTEYEYDLNGNQVGLTDDNDHTTTWAFNERDLLASITYADTNARTFGYNDDDTLAGWTDENGTVVTNGYNDNGWLTARSIDRATGVLGPTSESYYYDGLGRQVGAVNDNSVVDTEYDTLSRMVSQTQGPNPLGQDGKTISYTYEDDGSRSTATYPSGYELTYTVDAVGRWTKIEDSSSNELVTMSYYGPGLRMKQAGYLNGTSENLGWNGFRWVSDVDHKDSQSTVLAGFDYAYDAMGNPLYEERTHDSGRGDAYAYDQAYRLTAALIGSDDPSAEIADDDWLDYPYVKTIDYNMDAVSNRTSVVNTDYGQQGVTTSYTSNSVNWYTVVGGVSRTHDANGNLIADGTYDYSYDYRNNLVKVEQGETVVAEYEFDALGRRTVKTVGQAETKFFYDGEECVEEYDGSDELLRKFVYGQRIDEIRLMIAPDVADVDGDQNTTEVLNFYYHHNMLGSVTQITGPDETVVEQYEYRPYGETTIRDGQGNDLCGQSAIGNPYMFMARRLDSETGLYYTAVGAYDVVVGRNNNTTIDGEGSFAPDCQVQAHENGDQPQAATAKKKKELHINVVIIQIIFLPQNSGVQDPYDAVAPAGDGWTCKGGKTKPDPNKKSDEPFHRHFTKTQVLYDGDDLKVTLTIHLHQFFVNSEKAVRKALRWAKKLKSAWEEGGAEVKVQGFYFGHAARSDDCPWELFCHGVHDLGGEVAALMCDGAAIADVLLNVDWTTESDEWFDVNRDAPDIILDAQDWDTGMSGAITNHNTAKEEGSVTQGFSDKHLRPLHSGDDLRDKYVNKKK